jgi:hypothetical protein
MLLYSLERANAPTMHSHANYPRPASSDTNRLVLSLDCLSINNPSIGRGTRILYQRPLVIVQRSVPITILS